MPISKGDVILHRLFACLAIFLLTVPAAVRAGEYHFGATLLCSDCHTIHFSQTHNWDGSVPVSSTALPDGNWLPASGPNDYLLKAASPNALCLQCHDGQTFAPDVRGANQTSYVRQGGTLTTGTAPYENWKGHTLDIQATPPGSFVSMRLQCINCHDKHGNTGFRNVAGITYALGTNDTTKDAFLRAFTIGNLGQNYSADNVDFNEPVANQSRYGQFCRGCHVDFHGRRGDSNMGGDSSGRQWVRHPTADANIGSIGGEHSSVSQFAGHPYRVKVMSPAGDWGPAGSSWVSPRNDLTPTCVSCHKAHGNENPFALIFLSGTGPLNEQGDPAGNSGSGVQKIRSLCGQCHVE